MRVDVPTATLPTRALAVLATCALILAVLVVPSAPAQALDEDVVYEVTTTADGALADDGFDCPAEDGDECSLRAAVETISADTTAAIGSYTIEVPIGTYPLDHADGQLVLDTDTPVTIVGTDDAAPTFGDDGIIEASSTAIIDADLSSRILDVTDATDLTVERVSLRNGDAGNQTGGAIRNMADPAGTLTVVHARIEGNQGGANGNSGGAVRWRNGAVDVLASYLGSNSLSGVASGGGALASNRDVTITDSVLADNTSGSDGGAIMSFGSSQVTITASQLLRNTAATSGGAVRAASITIDGDSTLAENAAGEDGGALSSVTTSGTITLGPNVVLSDNRADGRGGAIHVTDLAVVVDGATLRDNRAAGGGGAIATETGAITLNAGSLVEDNWVTSSGSGGAILAYPGEPDETAVVSVTDSHLRGNTTPSNGGAIAAWDATVTVAGSLFEANASSSNFGGAIHLDGGQGTIDGSTFRDNSARANGGAVRVRDGELAVTDSVASDNVAGNRGGGLDSSGSDGELTVTNSTISGNRAEDGGGGIAASTSGTVALDSVTVTANEVTADGAEGAGLSADNSGAVTLVNSIVAGNLGPAAQCVAISGFGSFTSQGHNLDSDDSCELDDPDDVPEGDADLGPLADNGGPTLTHALGADSDAREAGATDLGVDQRGVDRPQGGQDDIGAVEMVPLPDGCDWAWTGASSDSWHDASNWDGPAGTPGGPTDTVCIDTDVNLPVVHDTGDTTLGAVSNTTDLDGTGVRLEDGTLTLSDAAELEHLGLALAGDDAELVVDTELVVAGASSFANGVLSGDGVTTFGGDLAVEAPGAKEVAGHDVRLEGTTTMSSTNPLRLSDDSTVTNLGTVELDSAAAFSQALADTDNVVLNRGTIRKATDGTTLMTAALRNEQDGTVAVDAGRLTIDAEGSSVGEITVADGATLEFATDTFRGFQLQPNANSSLTGAGTVEITGDGGGIELESSGTDPVTYDVGRTVVSHAGSSEAQLWLDADATTGELLVDHGRIVGTSPPRTLTVDGDFTFGEGTIDWQVELGPRPPARIRIDVGGTLRLVEGEQRVISGDITAQETSVQSDGLLRILAESVATDSVHELTGGEIELRIPAGVSQVINRFTAPLLDISGDGLVSGIGEVDADVDNAGTVSPGTTRANISPGAIEVTGDYGQTADGTLGIELGGGEVREDGELLTAGEFDRLLVAGDATLDGTLDVTLVGGFTPEEGDEFVIVTGETVSGTFAEEQLPDLGDGLQLEVDHRDQAVVLSVVEADDTPPPPEPTLEACPEGAVPPSGFDDVVGNFHEDAIDCALWHGLTNGVTASAYRPEQDVTRDQMAAFVARLIEAAGGHLPTVDEDAFGDIAGSTHTDRINQLAEVGVVQGRTADRFDPRDPVTRAQAASLLVRAYRYVTGDDLPAPAAPFVDIAGTVHEEAIDAAFAAGVTRGQTPTTFEPGASTPRDQMAAFLTRMLERFAAEGRVERPDAG